MDIKIQVNGETHYIWGDRTVVPIVGDEIKISYYNEPLTVYKRKIHVGGDDCIYLVELFCFVETNN